MGGETLMRWREESEASREFGWQFPSFGTLTMVSSSSANAAIAAGVQRPGQTRFRVVEL